MNLVTLTGRLTKDIELRYTSNGKAVASGTIAVQRKFKNAEGQYDADFINFVAWGKGGELLAQYVQKGDKFGISGQIQTRNYENNEGRRVFVTEVNVQDFDFPDKPKQSAPQQNNTQQKPQDDPFADGSKTIDIDTDELPF
jgi:single-strand DNA-binding protein